MPDYNFKNNLKSTLQAKLWSDATSIYCNHVVNSTDADARRNAWPAFPFTLTVVDTANDHIEIIKCTSLANNSSDAIVFHCDRAQENTTAQTFEIATTSVEHRLTSEALNSITNAVSPATTTSRGIARVATLADMEPDAVVENGPAFLDAATFKFSSIPAANVIPMTGNSSYLSQGWFGTMLCNKSVTISSSGTYTATVTGWHRVTCIGAGGQGGGNGATTGGAQGGTTSFGAASARGGSGGGAGNNYAGGGGGEAGAVTTTYMYLTTGQTVTATIGAGSTATSGSGQGSGPLPGYAGNVNGSGMGGGGASGAGNGGCGISGVAQGAVGGSGGQGTLGYGGGGGGVGGLGATLGYGGTPGFGGTRPAQGATVGGAGGPGAVMLEYFDPNITS